MKEKSQKSLKNSWLAEKIKQCSEKIGVTVTDYEGGWDSVIHFAKDNDFRNRVAIGLENDKKKRKRELTNQFFLNNLRKKL